MPHDQLMALSLLLDQVISIKDEEMLAMTSTLQQIFGSNVSNMTL